MGHGPSGLFTISWLLYFLLAQNCIRSEPGRSAFRFSGPNSNTLYHPTIGRYFPHPRPFVGNYPGGWGYAHCCRWGVPIYSPCVYILSVRWMCVCSSCTTIYWHVNLFCLLLYTNKFTMINYLFVAWKYLFVHAINFGDSHFLLFVLYNPVFTMFDCFCSLYIITVYQVYSFRVSK